MSLSRCSVNTTSLGCGKDPIKESGLACHLLDVNQSCVLLECPLDLSTLALFLPTPLSTHAVLQSSARQTVSSKATLHGTAGRKRKGNRDVHRDVFLRPSGSTKRVRLNSEEREDNGAGENGWDKGGEHKETISPFKDIHGQVLANGEPWYKVAGLELVDVGLLDAVIISNPSGMLGLPFLTKHPDFCGKVYATKATAEIGRLMMEELVLMHAGFVQSHGSVNTGPKPPWLDPSVLGTLPVHMTGSLLGRCFSDRANWQPLYSAQDIRDCFVHVQKLRFGEEVNINGSLRVSPLSSGMGIGASNWILSGARQSVGYVAASLVTKNHAMPLDKAPLAECHALIISDVEFSHEAVVTEKPTSSREDHAVKGPEIPERGVSGTEHVGPLRQSSSGSGSLQRPAQRATGSFPSVATWGGLSSSSIGVAKSGTVGLPFGTGIEKVGKAGSDDLDATLRSDVTTSDLMPEVASTCKGAVEALRKGGSVLFPVSPSGLLLELLDELGVQLAAANLKHIPIHYISTAAEEMLAYCNTVPEWLCSARQGKLYAGESLFGYVDLMQEGRLRHSKVFSSPELQKVWQEPCVVFAAHCSLRMGPAAYLLHRWRQNPLCLLILTEGELDKDLLLAPYMPLSMQVLQLRPPSRLRSEEVASLLQSIQPQIALVPEFLQKSLGAGSTDTKVVLGYKTGRSVRVPNFETELEVDMSAELALQVQPNLVKPKKVAAAPFQADFCFRDGKLSLQIPTASGLSSEVGMSSHDYQYRWGEVNVGALSRALQERGMGDVSFHDPLVDELSTVREGNGSERKSLRVEIRSPSRAWIELGPSSSHIKANDPSLRHLIADAVKSVLQVM